MSSRHRPSRRYQARPSQSVARGGTPPSRSPPPRPGTGALLLRLPRGRGELPRGRGAPGARPPGSAAESHHELYRRLSPRRTSRDGAHRWQRAHMMRVACLLGLIALAILIADRGASRRCDRHHVLLPRHPGAGRRRWDSTCSSAGEPAPSTRRDTPVPRPADAKGVSDALRGSTHGCPSSSPSPASRSPPTARRSSSSTAPAATARRARPTRRPARRSRCPRSPATRRWPGCPTPTSPPRSRRIPSTRRMLKTLTDDDLAAVATYVKGLAAGK